MAWKVYKEGGAAPSVRRPPRGPPRRARTLALCGTACGALLVTGALRVGAQGEHGHDYTRADDGSAKVPAGKVRRGTWSRVTIGRF